MCVYFMSLPIFDLIVKEIKPGSPDITGDEKMTVMSLLKNIEDYQKEMLYAIVKYYQTKNNSDQQGYPYKGRYNKDGIIFNLEDFPITLKRVIFIYLTKYTNVSS